MMKIDEFITSMPFAIMVSLLGMFVHFLKKKVRGETLIEVRDYFKNNLKSTIVAFIGTIVTALSYYATMPEGSNIDLVAYFLIGFSNDSFFNKWDKIG